MTEMQERMQAALNEQASKELFASNQYLAASFFFAQRNLDNIAKYLVKESDSEREHAKKFFDYIHLRSGGVGVVSDVKAPTNGWSTPQEVFEAVLQMERENTKSILNLRSLAVELKDQGAEIFLNWFVQEQENSVSEWEKLNEQMKSFTALPGLIWHLEEMMG